MLTIEEVHEEEINKSYPQQDNKAGNNEKTNRQEDIIMENFSPPRDRPIQQSSLRQYLYELQNKHNQNLIHAVYPASDGKRIFVLCAEHNRISTLKILQNLEAAITTLFEESASSTYFPRIYNVEPHGKVILFYQRRCAIKFTT